MFMSFWNFNVKIVTQVVFNSVEWSPVAVAVFLIDLMTLMSDARPAACGLSASKYQQKRWGRISFCIRAVNEYSWSFTEPGEGPYWGRWVVCFAKILEAVRQLWPLRTSIPMSQCLNACLAKCLKRFLINKEGLLWALRKLCESSLTDLLCIASTSDIGHFYFKRNWNAIGKVLMFSRFLKGFWQLYNKMSRTIN